MNLSTQRQDLTLKSISFLLIFLSVALFVQAQTPQYYNSNIPGNSNSFPFNMPSGKATQWLFLPGDFSQPSPLPSGKKITTIYFHASTTGTRTFTDLTVLMKQDTITQLPLATLWGPMDTVYYESSATISSTSGGWFSITLETQYNYDPTKSLIVFVGQCGATGSGVSINQGNYSGNRRNWSVGGCPFVPFSGTGNSAVANFGVDVVNATPSYPVPDLIYYKFENNPSTSSVLNFAVPGAGSPIATLTSLTLSHGGQFDSCLYGTAITSSKIATGYNLSTGTSSFTISFWLADSITPASTRYLFGDPGHSFRCFIGGVAPSGGAILRGTGVTNVPINNILPGPSVVHLVYDSATTSVTVYKNGVKDNTVIQSAPFNFTSGSGFSVGGYSSSAGLQGYLDEFRFYKRALDSAEIAATWNLDLNPLPVNINPVSAPIPKDYSLSQNYPNPFNPVTNIRFQIPSAKFVKLAVYDMLGREVEVLINENKPAGSYLVSFDASELSSGIYFYKLITNDFSDVKKMVLIK